MKKNTTGKDLFRALHNVDYIFSSSRDTSSIYTKNNRLLIKQPTIKISKKDISNLKHKKQKKNFTTITLDFLDNKYIISKISNY